MARPTDDNEADVELIHGEAEPDHSLVLTMSPGEYIIFPSGVRTFAAKHNAEAVSVDPDGHVDVLRSGIKKDQMKWVRLTLECDD